MGSVTTVLLATLLPTCFLIYCLVVLSIYLYVKLRAVTVERHTVRAQPAIEEPVAAEEASEHVESSPRRPGDPYLTVFSDAADPDWGSDMLKMTAGFVNTFLEKGKTYPESEETLVWASKVLQRLGYQEAPPAVILDWIQGSSQLHATVHLSTHIALAMTSFENQWESTLLPFTPETYKGLQNCFKALEGIDGELSTQSSLVHC